MASIYGYPKFKAFDSNGVPLAGGQLFTYAAGTTTPIATYQDNLFFSPNTNPVILDSRGECLIWGNATYKFVLQDSVGSTIWTIDNISPNGGAATNTYTLLPISTAQILSYSTTGNLYEASTALTITIPQTSTLTTAWANAVFAVGGNVTVALAYGTDKINGGTPGASVVIPKGFYATFATDAAGNIYLEMGQALTGNATLSSAATTDLGSTGLQSITVSGTTTITSLGISAQAGQIFNITFSDILTLTHNAVSLILPTAANITTAAGDTATVQALGSGNFKVIGYQTASGHPLAGGGNLSYLDLMYIGAI